MPPIKSRPGLAALCTALLLGFVHSAFAAEDAKAPPSDAEQAAINAASRTGVQMFRHDRAAWIATDVAMKLPAFKREKRVKGWITEARGDEIRVTFFGVVKKDADLVALYRVVVGDAKSNVGELEVLKTPEPLSVFESRAVAARNLAMKSLQERCAKNYNTIVMPAAVEDREGWLVYLLPAATKNDVLPIGGAYRIEIDSEATAVQATRGFTKSCIAIEATPGAMVTHLMDPTPTEVHVFWSLTAGKEFFVSTTSNDILWRMDGQNIELAQRGISRAPAEGTCAVVFTDKAGKIVRQELASLHVGVQTAKQPKFVLPADAPPNVQAVMCDRSSIVPYSDDHKVVDAGFPFYILSDETGALRSLGLEKMQGQFRVRMVEGELTPEENVAVQKVLNDSQDRNQQRGD